MTFSVLRAKKAKHGFKMSIHDPDAIVSAGNAIVFAKGWNGVTIEFDKNFGKSELKIYSDNPTFAAEFEQNWC